MKVFVNYLSNTTNELDFESRISNFHASLIVQKIKILNINDTSKKKLLNSILKEFLKK